MPASDEELVRRSKQGDRQAFRALVERYQRKAIAIALGMLHDPEDAREVAQDAFTKVYTRLHTFKEEASFSTWLYRIVVNLAIDRQRQRGKRASIEWHQSGTDDEDDWIESIPDAAGRDPAGQVENRELARHVWAAINELTPVHKAAIVLRSLEGLSYDEISQVLQCSRGTVMSRLHYARKKLHARLEDDR